MHIACLDTESTSTGKYNEILELAIFSARGELVLNSLYKPRKNRRWPHSEKIHGISPEMVQDKPHFQDNLRKIQKIFDRSDMVLGFALTNDIQLLEKSGVTGLAPERCMDVRDLFWAVYGEELGMDFFHVPSLVKCAEHCGYEWEEDAHSAAADAKATLFCYDVLMKLFIKKYNLCPIEENQQRLTDEQINTAWQYLRSMVETELLHKAMEKAKGWLFLLQYPEGYSLVARKKPLKPKQQERLTELSQEEEAPVEENPSENGIMVAGIELADCSKGYEEMTAYFAPKLVKREGYYKTLYQLDKEDIQHFQEYRNTFEA